MAHLNVLIFAIYVGNTSSKCSVSFILNIFYNRVTLFVMTKCHFHKILNGAVVRYYGNWKWCSYIACHKPIKCGHLVGNTLYFTIILTYISIEGKSKSYKHSLIIYWTALVWSNGLFPGPVSNNYDLCYQVAANEQFSNCQSWSIITVNDQF